MIIKQRKDLAFLFTILVLTCFLGTFRFALPFSGLNLNVNLSQLVLVLFILYLVIIGKFNLTRIFEFYDTPSIFIVLYFACNLFSSIVFGNGITSVKSALVILFYASMFFLTKYTLKYLVSPYYALEKLLVLGISSALFGLLSMIYSLVFRPGPIIGVSLGHLQSGAPSIRSLSFEPNLFAIITASCFCIYLSCYVMLNNKFFKTKYVWIFVLSIIFAYTRSVYFGLLLSVIMLFLISGKVRLERIIAIFILCLIGMLVISTIFPNNVLVQSIFNRTGNITNFSAGSAVGRSQAYQTGINGFLNNPIFGNGTMSADTKVYDYYLEEYKDLNGSSGWLTGFWIQALHDTGCVGLIISMCLLLSFIKLNYVSFKKEIILHRKALFLGFFVANILIAICTQVSSVMWISFTYVFWGINMSFLNYKYEIKQ